MNQYKKRIFHWLEAGASVALGAVFLISGLGKTAYPYQFFRAVEAYRLVATHEAMYVAMVLPIAELLVGLFLLSAVARGGALICAACLGALFVFVNTSVIVRNMVIPCGCFGGGSNGETVGMWTLLRAIAVLLLAVIGLYAALRRADTSRDATKTLGVPKKFPVMQGRE
jgi:hypothetical protein